MVIEDEKILLASVTFRKKTDIVRVWQISDGKNFAFVTYTCDSGYPNDEIEKCEVILRVVVKFGWF